MWKSGNLEVWKCGSLAVWKYGSLAVGKSSSVEVWKSGSVAVWKCGSLQVRNLRDRSKIRGGGGRAGAFLFWPTSFGETLPIPGAEKMLTPQKCLHNLS